MRTPDRPAPGPTRVIPELLRYTTGDSFVCEGASRTAVFTGPGATDVLPQLCELLDGTRTVGEAGRAAGLTDREAAACVGLLRSRELTDEAPAVPAPAARTPEETPEETLAFLSRASGYTRRHSGGAVLAENLRRACVLVAGRHPLATSVREELRAGGVRVVEDFGSLLETLRATRTSPAQAAGMVVGIVDGPEETGADLLRECRRAGVLWLAAGLDAAGGFVGPLLHPDYSCFPCARRHLDARRGPPGEGVHGAAGRIVAGLAAAEVVHALTGAATVTTVNRTRTVTREDTGRDDGPAGPLSFGTDPVTCTGRCTGGGLAPDALLPWTYEQHIEIPGPYFATPARTPDLPPLPGHGARRLPTCPSAPRAEVVAASQSCRTPATVLYRTLGRPAGLAAGDERRRVPSAGGLASQDAFVVARAPLAPLGSHTAWYDGQTDRLVATAPTTGADVARLAARALPDADWRHALVWVARLDELWQKYDDFAVRLAHLDAGVALTHAAVLAAALGSPPRMPTSWHAAPFAELLDLTPDTELVTGIMLF